MDDRELEARLKTRLRTRFDAAPVPVELAPNVRQALTTAPTRIGFEVRPTGRWLGWAAVAAAVVIAVVAVTLGTGIMGPAAPRSTATPNPAPSVAAERVFIVLPRAAVPAKPVTSLASDILAARLQALGIGTFSSGGGYAITFTVPGDGPSDEQIRAVLGATGDVKFVPVLSEAFASLQPVAGDALPANLPALFGYDGIASVKRATSDQGFPVLDITLTLSGARAFGDYTAAHIGDYLAIVLDGKMALIPVITSAIPGGEVQVSGGGDEIPGRPDTSFDVAAAILVGGRLPAEWQGARVPEIVTEQFAINAALGQFTGAEVVSATLAAEPIGDAWMAVWSVTVSRDDLANQQVPCPTPGPSGNGCPAVGPTRVVVVNAEGGGILRIEIPPA